MCAGLRSIALATTQERGYGFAMRGRAITLKGAEHLPRWRRPSTLLFLMAAAMTISFATWPALLGAATAATALFLINQLINRVAAPHMVRAVGGFGERDALIFPRGLPVVAE